MKLFGNTKRHKHVKPSIGAQSEKVLQDIDDSRQRLASGGETAAQPGADAVDLERGRRKLSRG